VARNPKLVDNRRPFTGSNSDYEDDSMSPPISPFVTKPKPVDVCQVRCVNTELLLVSEALPGDDVLEEAQILLGF